MELKNAKRKIKADRFREAKIRKVFNRNQKKTKKKERMNKNTSINMFGMSRNERLIKVNQKNILENELNQVFIANSKKVKRKINEMFKGNTFQS